MPISRLRHSETTISGEPLYVIETKNREFDGYRMRVEFKKGRGLTKEQNKAQRFSEEFGYTVHLHNSVSPWTEAKTTEKAYVSYDEDDREIVFEDEGIFDEDGEEIESYE